MASPPKTTDGETEHLERRICVSGAPAHPLEDTNILPEILLRLPPLPSSLFRASPVCKHWGHVVSDPHFHRRFRAHHKKPPLLGFFLVDHLGRDIVFRPAMNAPNRIPAAHFSLRLENGTMILGCRHGRLLALNQTGRYFVVWDPITGDLQKLTIPPKFMEKNFWLMNGAVLCAARENGHVHGACHSDPFKVVFLGWNMKMIFASIYSSEAGTWGKLISVLEPRDFSSVLFDRQSYLIGDSLYWVLREGVGEIVKFDLHRKTLTIMDVRDAYNYNSFEIGDSQFLIMPSDGGSLSFIVLDGFTAHVWNKVTNGDDVPTRWVLKNTVKLIDLLSLKPSGDTIKSLLPLVRILGVDEDDKVMFKVTESGVVYMVHLETLQFKELPQKMGSGAAHPFASFYTEGIHIHEAGNDGDKKMKEA
ncbi:unnamed protein product [Urochloa humidicola]